MNVQVHQRSACRVCGSARLVRYVDLPPLPMTDAFLREEQLGTEFMWPIAVYYCQDCHLSQTQHDIDAAGYYLDYQYSVAQSPFAQRFMQRLAEALWRDYGLEAGDTVVEVGSSDGAQLAAFKALGARVFGFEPSAPLAEAAERLGIPTAQRLFDAGAERHIPAELLPVQVLLLTYTFDHLPDPTGFLAAAASVLDPERGLLVIEVHDLEKIVERREFCLFEHEHTTYYTDATIQRHLARAGFDLLSTSVLPEAERRGNSLLVVAARQGSQLADRRLPPLDLGAFDDVDRYAAFGKAVDASLERFRGMVQETRAKGKRLAGYGAGGRGVMTLAAASKPGDFAYLMDRNKNFHGLYTPGAHVPVRGPEQAGADPVDRIVVFSFGYLAEIRDDLARHGVRPEQLVSLLDVL